MVEHGSSKSPRKRVCKDCRALPYQPLDGDFDPAVEYRPRVDRPAPHKGPRCTSHNRAYEKQQSKRNHELRVVKTYGIELGEYDQLYFLQRGVCFICQRATGAKKRLAVDHDHVTGEVRGLLCGPCNKGILGHLHDDINALLRAVEYLKNPPARLLGRRSV